MNNRTYLGRLHGELVKGHDLTSGLQDAGTCGLGEAECGNTELRHVGETGVVSDVSDDDAGLVLSALHVEGNAGQGHRGEVGAAHHKTVEHGLWWCVGTNKKTATYLVERALGTAGQEAVDLHQQVHVGVGGGGLSAKRVVLLHGGGVSSHFNFFCVLV